MIKTTTTVIIATIIKHSQRLSVCPDEDEHLKHTKKQTTIQVLTVKSSPWSSRGGTVWN